MNSDLIISYDLQIENAAKTLLLADTYNASPLKRNTLLFIGKHGGQVLATNEWDNVKPNAALLQELLPFNNCTFDKLYVYK